MTSSRTQQALFLTLSAAAVAASLGVTAPVAVASPTAAATRSGGAPLDWRPCPQAAGGPAAQECADLRVPLDYAAPDGPHVTVAVTRLRGERAEGAGRAPRGALAVIPGGPGGSGVQEVAQQGAALREATRGAYDLVSLDPRGVGASTRADCELAPGDRLLTTMRSWPAADGSITQNVARSRRTAEACQENGGAVLRSFTTANEARDLDRLRQALGESRLSAWGTSYGTYVAAVYAQKFPSRTDRVVLDSSGDPDPSRVERGWLANMARGVEDRFPDFARWAADPARGELRLATHASQVEPLVEELAARLDRAPTPSTTPEAPLTGTVLRQALQNALYDDAAFPSFAALVRQAQDPSATPELPAELAQPIPQEDAAVSVGVICNDVAWPRSGPAFRAAVARDRARHPLTAGMPVNITPCSFWRAPAEKPVRITGEGPSNVLMVQNLRDPATPYSGALRMRAAFGQRARLVTVDSGGHGVYLGNGNACGDRAVTGFLTGGKRPAEDLFCPAEN